MITILFTRTRRSHQLTSWNLCTSDPLLWLLKQSVEVLLAPFLCPLFNWSFQSGIVPSTFKFAYITPLLKKADLDPADAKSYRPISNLPVISRLLERLVSKQLQRYLWICFQTFSRHIDGIIRRSFQTYYRHWTPAT